MTSNYIFQDRLIQSGSLNLIEDIKLLLYKTNERVFEKINFANDNIYREPLLFSYFNDKSNDLNTLDIILLGYIEESRSNNNIEIKSDAFGRCYLPNRGWIVNLPILQTFTINIVNNLVKLFKDNKPLKFELEPIEYIENTKIELIKYPIELLSQFYYDVNYDLINVEIQSITAKHLGNITTAFNLIRKNAAEHFRLIELVTAKVVIFNVDTYLRNSFATISAHGIAFFNACQDNYNEVFFVDDIAHQTGHIIFNAMIYNTDNLILIPTNSVIETTTLPNGTTETRDLHVLFHALYTYYATLICLDACLEADAFISHKKHEAIGRIAFYIGKCYKDLSLIEKPANKLHTSENLFTSNGLIIYNQIKAVFSAMVNKWGPLVHHFEMANQPYNFNYSIFLASNPIDETP